MGQTYCQFQCFGGLHVSSMELTTERIFSFINGFAPDTLG